MLANGDRTPPAVVPLNFAFFNAITLDEVGIAAVPLWTLPGASLEEEGVERFLAREKGADLEVAAIFPLLRRVHDAVSLVEVFFGPRPDVILVTLVVVEPCDVCAVRVDHSGVAISHPLGDDLRHARAFFHPDSGRRPKVTNFGGLAEARHRVRRERE